MALGPVSFQGFCLDSKRLETLIAASAKSVNHRVAQGNAEAQSELPSWPSLPVQDPSKLASGAPSRAKAPAVPPAGAPDAAIQAALPPAAVGGKSCAKPGPRLPRSRESALPPRTSESRQAAAGRLPSLAAPERPPPRSQPPAAPPSTTAKPAPHTAAPIAAHIVAGGRGRIPPPRRREPNSARRWPAFR